jgi:hypothetical protein
LRRRGGKTKTSDPSKNREGLGTRNFNPASKGAPPAHHGYFKQQNGALYWDLIRRHIGPERWAWLQRVIADRRSYAMGIYEWSRVEMALKQELSEFQEAAEC